jgi:hypothetical protein
MPSLRRARSAFLQHSPLFRHLPFARGPSQSSQEGHGPLAPERRGGGRRSAAIGKTLRHGNTREATPAFGRVDQVRQVNAPPGSPSGPCPSGAPGGARMRVCHFARDVGFVLQFGRSGKRPGAQETIEPGGRFAKTNPSGSKFILNNQPSLDAFSSAFTNAGVGPLSIAFANLRPAAFALVDLIAVVTWCAAALLFSRTPGCSPFVNSTPAASSARCKASIVRSFNSSPRSNLATVSIETFAAAARSRMPKPTAARAIRHWIGRIIIAQLRF